MSSALQPRGERAVSRDGPPLPSREHANGRDAPPGVSPDFCCSKPVTAMPPLARSFLRAS